MIQSLVRSGKVLDLVANYGQIIVDECHHLQPSRSSGCWPRQRRATSSV
jgi:superfamily II DNA or RNA helicase